MSMAASRNPASTADRAETLVQESPLLEALHDAVFATDRNGVITAWNRGAQRLYGYAPAEVRGLPLTFLRFPEDLEQHREAIIAPALEHGVNQLVVRHRRKDGTEILVELRLAALRHQRGVCTQLIGCADDVSTRRYPHAQQDEPFGLRQRRAQLAHRLRLRTIETLAYRVLSELHQHLSAVLNYANGTSLRLRARQYDENDLLQAAEGIKQEALRAATALRRVRDEVRTDRPKRQYRRCSVNQLIRDAVQLIEEDAREDAVRLTLHLAPDDPSAMVDSLEIEQLVSNLLGNALDAMRGIDTRARELTITTAVPLRGNDVVEVRISDTGDGLPADIVEHLFEPFHTTKSHTIGVGLSICRAIVDAHQGRISATANEPYGTTFTFTLPSDRAPNA